MKEKRDDFVRLRLNQTEKMRIDTLVQLTCRKQSDLYREAMYEYIKNNFPDCLAGQ
jgi:predicted DNA-binding protein